MKLVGMLAGMQRHMERGPEATPESVAYLRRITEARIEWLLDFADLESGRG